MVYGPYFFTPEEVPFIELLNSQDIASFNDWINTVRLQAGLNLLKDDNIHLQASSKRLAKRMTVRHDRRQLRQERKTLSEHELELLGENRVEGVSYEEMAWLLWNSPRHRNLLLNPKATHVSIGDKVKNQRSLAVLVFAKALNKL